MQVNEITRTSLYPTQEPIPDTVKKTNCIKSDRLKKGVLTHVTDFLNKLIFRVLSLFFRKKAIKNEISPGTEQKISDPVQDKKLSVQTTISESNMFYRLDSSEESKSRWRKAMVDVLAQHDKKTSLEEALQIFEDNCRNQLKYPVVSWDGTPVRVQVLIDAQEFLLHRGFASKNL